MAVSQTRVLYLSGDHLFRHLNDTASRQQSAGKRSLTLSVCAHHVILTIRISVCGEREGDKFVERLT